MKIKNFITWNISKKGVLKCFKISKKCLNISKWNISLCIPSNNICKNTKPRLRRLYTSVVLRTAICVLEKRGHPWQRLRCWMFSTTAAYEISWKSHGKITWPTATYCREQIWRICIAQWTGDEDDSLVTFYVYHQQDQSVQQCSGHQKVQEKKKRQTKDDVAGHSDGYQLDWEDARSAAGGAENVRRPMSQWLSGNRNIGVARLQFKRRQSGKVKRRRRVSPGAERGRVRGEGVPLPREGSRGAARPPRQKFFFIIWPQTGAKWMLYWSWI